MARAFDKPGKIREHARGGVDLSVGRDILSFSFTDPLFDIFVRQGVIDRRGGRCAEGRAFQ